MKKFLQNIDIQFISLVRKGANNRTVIFKSADDQPELKQFQITKTDDIKQMVYGIVYAPDDVDAHGHQATAKEIEAAAHRFMKSLSVCNIDKNHTYKPEGAFVAENWIIRDGDPLFPTEKPGAWACGIKIEDAALYKEAKENLPAISMAGTADIVTIENSADTEQENEKSLMQKLLNFINKSNTNTNTNDEGNEMDEKKVQEMIDAAIAKAVDAIPKPLDEAGMATVIKAAIEDTVKPVTERLDKIEKSSPGTRQDDKEPTAEDIAKQVEIGKRIAKMMGVAPEGGK